MRFAGPLFAHWAQSDVMSGWLECERRMLGRGGDSVEGVMLTAGKRYSRVGGRAEDEPSEGICSIRAATLSQPLLEASLVISVRMPQVTALASLTGSLVSPHDRISSRYRLDPVEQ